MAILAEVRLEMIKYILWREDVEGEGGCERVEAVHVKKLGRCCMFPFKEELHLSY